MSTVIHIGANKAASTTLQRHLFSKHPMLHYVGEDGVGYSEYKSLMESLLFSDDIFWDRSAAIDFFDKKLSLVNNRTFVFSSEDIVTSPISSQCLYRLKSILGEAKILLIIRNQIESIISYYINHGAYLRNVPYSYFRRYVSFDDWMQYNIEVAHYGPIFGLQYFEIVDFCEKVFGCQSVRVLLFEDFINRREHFVDQLSLTLCIPSEEIAKNLQLAHSRKRNTVRRHVFHKVGSSTRIGNTIIEKLMRNELIHSHVNRYLDGGGKYTEAVPDQWMDRVCSRFRAGNERLAIKYDLPLREYGYPLPT